jgi:hypothetical protein
MGTLAINIFAIGIFKVAFSGRFVTPRLFLSNQSTIQRTSAIATVSGQ